MGWGRQLGCFGEGAWGFILPLCCLDRAQFVYLQDSPHFPQPGRAKLGPAHVSMACLGAASPAWSLSWTLCSD